MTAAKNRSDTPPDPRSDIPHGRPGSYTNHRCRCPECREAWRLYCRDNRERNHRNYARLQAQLSAAD